MLTYKEARNKIIDAYFKDEIEPMSMEFCFCGTLAPNCAWRSQLKGEYPYTPLEYARMESALLRGCTKNFYDNIKTNNLARKKVEEDDLFKGMSDALDVLRQIHIERGENVEDNAVFTKREKKEAINV
jgi:hypothetical protein